MAPLLVPGSDAGSSEDLGISLAFSLPKNARAVLAAIDPKNGHITGADRVCGMPFIEDTVKDRAAYKRQAVSAVRSVHDKKLQPIAKRCLQELKSSS